jgi:molecular chaperone GrpE
MDDKARKAEELLEERRSARTNGETHGDTHGVVADVEAERPVTADARAETVKVEELTNDLKRMTADFANYRKRNEAERNEFAKFAKADLIAKLLDVLDGYDRALGTVPEEVKGQPWVEGMWLVERKLRRVLESEGLEPIDSLGKTFDPYLHQAVAHVESDAPEGTVIEEHQKAYRLHDRVIRPALVTVAKKKE